MNNGVQVHKILKKGMVSSVEEDEEEWFNCSKRDRLNCQ